MTRKTQRFADLLGFSNLLTSSEKKINPVYFQRLTMILRLTDPRISAPVRVLLRSFFLLVRYIRVRLCSFYGLSLFYDKFRRYLVQLNHKAPLGIQPFDKIKIFRNYFYQS